MALICLTITPAALAAKTSLPPESPLERLSLPDSHHGLDWNVFTFPVASPLLFLERPGSPEVEASALNASLPDLSQYPQELGEERQRRLLAWILALIGSLLFAMRYIPCLHSIRARFKSLNRLPVH